MTMLRAVSRQHHQLLTAAYLNWLAVRDGEPNMRLRTLSVREDFFRQCDSQPVFWDGLVPFEEFERACRATSPAEFFGISELALWMRALASVNEAEAFVINLALGKKTWSDVADVMSWVELEELFHTRHLVEALKVVLRHSAKFSEPHGKMRFFLILAAKSPRFFSDMLAVMGEIVGIVSFLVLYQKAAELFGTTSPAAKRIRSHLGEILIDEIGHFTYVRSKLGPIRMSIVRRVFPLVAPMLFGQYPVLGALFGLDRLLELSYNLDWEMIPKELLERAFLGEL